MDPQAFALLMARFDTIEQQNKEQLELIAQHVKDDADVKTVVERHSTYFSILSLGGAPLLTYLGHKLGWPKVF